MGSMFDRSDAGPLSQLGPGFTAGASLAPWTPDIAAQMARGQVPVVFSVDPRVKTFQTGRQNGGWVPFSTLLEVINRGATYSAPPLFTSATTNGSGAATLTLTAPAETTPPATFQGRDYRYAAFALDITSNNNTNNGQMVVSIAGTFEDGNTWTQQIVALPSIIGTARYFIIASEQFDGATYPALVTIQNQRLAAPRGTSLSVDNGGDDQTLVFNDDLRNTSVPLVFTLQGGVGLDIFLTALKPGNELWDDFYGFIMNIGKASGAR